MNFRSLTRGDAAVAAGALLLLIASFLTFFKIKGGCSGDTCEVSAWSTATFPMLPTVHLLALAAAVLFVLGHALGDHVRPLGLTLPQIATVLSVVVGWAALWSLAANIVPVPDEGPDPNDNIDLSAGAFLTVIGGLVVAVFGVLNSVVPAIKAPLMGAGRPQQQPYGAQPPQQGGYGYPGQPQQPYGGQPGGPQPPQQGGYGYPGQPQPGQPQPGQPQPGPQQGQPQGGPAAAPAADFQPFWFAVPVARPLFPEDGSPNPVAELAPGTWYLAVEQRGQALVAQTQDGRRGVLQDTSGIQRG
ncbi:hypothetical protein [Streptomyces sp. JJ36]|uniref:hypothetical protein n=1 Tax=Streptomyces sp. JJ36 TaxID=2736645 RepID=UPI001F1872FD|nr:hypothetical protein [Streptomyces sp. JJ36]MCF6526414.1 hypothetical protein [Streptomyces sp. JJ36]